MKERPILFSAPMVRAILAGKKTQTRRIVKHDGDMFLDAPRVIRCDIHDDGYGFYSEEWFYRCPYGSPGDRLWVRETWAECRNIVDGEIEAIHKAGPWRNENEPAIKWRPSIHMPRWASRITLEVVAVRVERLRDISQADAIAEGAPESHPSINRVSMDFGFPDFSRSYFAQLWQQINGPESWGANPWVWVIEFRRVEKGGAT